MDFKVFNAGSVVGFMPITPEAEAWWDEHVAAEDYQWLGPVCYADHRSAAPLIEALRAHGFELGG